MKTKLFYFLIALIISSCTIDNYTIPELKLSGKIMDAESGELVPSSGSNDGTIIKLFEGSSNQPLIFNTYPDGTFINSRLFSANYKVVAIGPFNSVTDTLNVNINADTKIEIKAIPNVRLKLTSSGLSNGKANVEIAFDKTDPDQKLLKLGVVWSTFPYPNVTVFPEGDIILEDVASMNLDEGKKVYEVTQLKANTKYYLRAFALTDNAGAYYNYSEQITIGSK